MEIINESSFTSPSFVSLLRWVRAEFKLETPVILQISDSLDKEWMTVGWTGRESPGRPILIKLGISKHKFPYQTRHAGIVTDLANLREEIVLVLAHELRHAEQIECGIFAAMKGFWAEADAEKRAVTVLQKYRNSKRLRA